MTELETLQAELAIINQQIQAIMIPKIAAEKAAMTEEQKIQQIKNAITAASSLLTWLQNN
jgi:hypothetical protein